MNLSFHMAVHILVFLSKHRNEQFSSIQIAESVCANPVQVRRVLSVLVQKGLIISKKGKSGGYSATKNIDVVDLGTLLDYFTSEHLQTGIHTGSSDNHCMISRRIEGVMTHHFNQAYEEMKAYYKQMTIDDIKQEILKEDTHENI